MLMLIKIAIKSVQSLQLLNLPSCVMCVRSVMILGGFFRLLRGAGVPMGISEGSAKSVVL